MDDMQDFFSSLAPDNVDFNLVNMEEGASVFELGVDAAKAFQSRDRRHDRFCCADRVLYLLLSLAKGSGDGLGTQGTPVHAPQRSNLSLAGPSSSASRHGSSVVSFGQTLASPPPPPEYEWSIVVGCKHRSFKGMYQHRLLLRGNGRSVPFKISYEKRAMDPDQYGLGKGCGREPQMLIMVSLEDHITISSEADFDNHMLRVVKSLVATETNIGPIALINMQPVTRGWSEHTVTKACVNDEGAGDILINQNPAMPLSLIFETAESHAIWFYSRVANDPRWDFSASAKARFDTRISDCPIPTYVLGSGYRKEPLPPVRSGKNFEDDAQFMPKRPHRGFKVAIRESANNVKKLTSGKQG